MCYISYFANSELKKLCKLSLIKYFIFYSQNEFVKVDNLEENRFYRCLTNIDNYSFINYTCYILNKRKSVGN